MPQRNVPQRHVPPRDFTATPHRHLKQARFLAELLSGATPPRAAARVGHSLKTFYTWRRRNPAFRRAWDKARLTAKYPPFPSMMELDEYIGTPWLLLPGESRSLTVPAPGDQPWTESITRCRADGAIEHTTRTFLPTAEQRAEIAATWRERETHPRRARGEPEGEAG